MKAKNGTLTVAALALALFTIAGCAHDGTLLTFQTANTGVIRASDQAILADAIDSAFAKIDVPSMKAKLAGAKTENAYLLIAAPFDLPDATMEYILLNASIVAGKLGIQIVEIEKTVERITPERRWEVVRRDYPDTDARVIMLVSYAGVDQAESDSTQMIHGSKEADTVLKGRFKGTFAVTPRKASFPAVVHTIEGESVYELAEGKFIDQR